MSIVSRQVGSYTHSH